MRMWGSSKGRSWRMSGTPSSATASRFHSRSARSTSRREDERAAMAAKQERLLEALRRIDFLAVLSPEELETVAQQAAVRVYLPGEAVVRQGDAGAEFFIILEGTADVRRGEGGMVATVATLHPMQFFGEMSLLTGEPRSATIVAQTKLEVVVVTTAVLQRPMMGNRS